MSRLLAKMACNLSLLVPSFLIHNECFLAIVCYRHIISFCSTCLCLSLSVTSSHFGTLSDCTSSAVTSISYEGGRLDIVDRRLDLRQSQHHRSRRELQISPLISLICLCTDSPSFSFSESCCLLSCNLFAQVFNWNCSSSFFQTATGLWFPDDVEQRWING